jgi:hypothetical protein
MVAKILTGAGTGTADGGEGGQKKLLKTTESGQSLLSSHKETPQIHVSGILQQKGF